MGDIELAPGGKELAGKLKLMEDLWDKLVRVKWSQPSFALLSRLARDLARTARQHEEGVLAELASKLDRHIDACLRTERRPEGEDWDELVALLQEMRLALSPAAAPAPRDEEVQTSADPSAPAAEIVVIGATEARQLSTDLEDAGFQVRRLSTLADAETVLARVAPLAVILDLETAEEPLAGIDVMARLRDRTSLRSPLFFVSRHGDIETRLASVRAGAAGYFTKPLDRQALLEKLNDCLLQAPRGDRRVLIIADPEAKTEAMALALEAGGMLTQAIARPSEVIAALEQFRPELVLLDLDLEAVSGYDLVRALRQHGACELLPIVLLCRQAELGLWLQRLQGEGDDLLGKPIAPEYLSWIVRQRLRRAHALRARLSALSHKDAVSGLYNRQYFLAHLERIMAASAGGRQPVAVMLVMLDNLRAVREATNVAASDQVLERAARRLAKALGPDVRAARFGDAIFAALIQSADDAALADRACAIRKALEAGIYKVGGHSVRLNVCIGIRIAGEGDRDYLTLIRDADLACSLAREAGGERIHIHHPASDREIGESHERHLLREIREAIDHERMNLLFQPIVALRGDSEERYEVLLRMRDGEDRELLPETVFAVAQQHDLSVALDRWVMAECIRLLKDRQGRASTTLFINLSPATFKDDSLAAWLDDSLRKAQVSGERIVFEVAESAARIHLEPLQRLAEQIRPLGCRLALERFGREADSMRLLDSLTVDYVKLDTSFVQGLVGNAAKQNQLRELVRALEARDTVPILGGVENLNTLPVLWSCGINYVQGFFLQRPHEKMSYDFRGGAF